MNPIHTDDAPAAVGPYSQAVVTTVTGRPGEMVFCSGQIPLVPGGEPGEMPNDIAAQTAQVLDNLTAVLRASGCDRTDVVKQKQKMLVCIEERIRGDFFTNNRDT